MVYNDANTLGYEVVLQPRSTVTIVKDGTMDNYSTYTYFDGLNRKVQIKTEGKNNQWITKDFFYNSSGKVYRESIAYYTYTSDYSMPEQQPYIENRFDSLGRIIEQITPDGNSIRKKYIKKSVFTLDANNHLTEEMVDKNVTISRSYSGVYSEFPDIINPDSIYSETKTCSAKNGVRVIDIAGNVIETHLDALGRKLSYSDPDLGTWYYTYDVNGNLKNQIDSKLNMNRFTYDSLNRLKTVESDTLTTYYYEDSGSISRIEYSGGSESFTYDLRGRMRSKTQIIGSRSATQYYEYDNLDRVIAMIYFTGEKVYNTYDDELNLESVKSQTSSQDEVENYMQNAEYSVLGQLMEWTFGNNLRTKYTYNNSFRVETIELYNPLGLLINTEYQYDNVGNMKSKVLNDVQNQLISRENYTYDAFNRLISTNSYGIHGYNEFVGEIFEYDNINNLTRKLKYSSNGVDDRYYTYSDSNKHGVVDDGRYTYHYDSNGNMLYRFENGVKNRTFRYDDRNRVISISDGGLYLCGAGEKRIYKSEDGVETYYFFPNYEEEISGSTEMTICYYFANGQRIAKRTQEQGQIDSTLVYIHVDHLQSATRVTDAEGNTIQTTMYTAFGEVGFFSGPQNMKYTYTGQEMEGNGLLYYNARFYDPALGRFLKADTVLDGLNRYAYCGNNPIVYRDPSGHWFLIDDLFFAAVGAVSGAVTGAVTALTTSIAGGSNFFEVAGATVVGAVAGAGTGAVQAFTGSLIAGPVGGVIGAVTGTLSSISIGTGVGAGAYNNPLTLLSDMTWNSLGSAWGGIEVAMMTIQNIFDPGANTLDYETTKENGALTYATTERSLVPNSNGFGLGNVAVTWSVETLMKKGWSREEAEKYYKQVAAHEAIHVGQQRAIGVLAMVDLGIEQVANISGVEVYSRGFWFGQIGLEYDAENYETSPSKNFFYNLNSWKWW